MTTDLTPRQVVRLVARRELRERLRSKLMIGSSLVFLAAILALAVLPALFRGDDTHRVGVVGTPATAAQLDAAARAAGARLDVRAVADADAADRLLTDGDLDAVLVAEGQVAVADGLDRDLRGVLDSAHRRAAVTGVLADAGVEPSRVGPAVDPPELDVRTLHPTDDATDLRRLLAFGGVVLLYMQLTMTGSMLASGVVEEKTSRVVELLLAKARPSHLLAGKVLGMGVLSFAQMLLFVVAGLTAASLAGTIDLPPATLQVGAEVLAWFVPGYAIYACLFAVSGALAGRPEDLQSTSQLAGLVMLLAYGAAGVTIANPDGLVARVTSFVPFTAPLVQPIRRAAGMAAWWEAPVGVAVVLVGIVVAIRVAGRVYARGALHFSGTMKLRDALSWS